MEPPGSHRYSRRPIFPGLQGVSMKNKPVNTFAESPIPQSFDGRRMVLPFLLIVGCECFGTEDSLSVNVSRRGHLQTAIGGVVSQGPKLSHWLIRLAGISHVVTRCAVVRFDRQPQAAFVSKPSKLAGIIFDQQIGDRLTKVPQKALGNFR